MVKQYETKTIRSLGQNFLRSPTVLTAMTRAAHLVSGETVLEVGPGEGVLTRELLAAGAVVTALELDARWYQQLLAELHSPALTVVHTDALTYPPPQTPYKLVANIPYYITAPLLQHFLVPGAAPHRVVLMVQKEVADRLRAAQGALGYLVGYWGPVELVCAVPRHLFSPAPRVDSAVIAFSPRDPGVSYERYQQLVTALTGGGNKKIKGLLARWCSPAVLAAAGLTGEERGREMTPSHLINLVRVCP